MCDLAWKSYSATLHSMYKYDLTNCDPFIAPPEYNFTMFNTCASFHRKPEGCKVSKCLIFYILFSKKLGYVIQEQVKIRRNDLFL